MKTLDKLLKYRNENVTMQEKIENLQVSETYSLKSIQSALEMKEYLGEQMQAR